MDDQTYKVRVEVGMILDIDVWACHEVKAAAIGEDIAHEVVARQMCDRFHDEDVYVAAIGVTAISAEPVNYLEGE